MKPLAFLATCLCLTSIVHGDNLQLGNEFFDLCKEGEHWKLDEILNENPRFANATDGDGEGCLHWASRFGHVGVLDVLLDKGADPNMRGAFLRMPPLPWNIYGREYEAVKLLLKKGADPNLPFDLKDEEDGPITVVTALDILLKYQSRDGTDYIFEEELAKYGARTYGELSGRDEL